MGQKGLKNLTNQAAKLSSFKNAVTMHLDSSLRHIASHTLNKYKPLKPEIHPHNIKMFSSFLMHKKISPSQKRLG